MPGYEKLADENLSTRRRVRYRYGASTVTLDYEKDRACLTLHCHELADWPPVSSLSRGEIDSTYLTEYLHQELGVDFEPEQYLVGIGGDPIVMVRVEPAAGITIRDADGHDLEVIQAPETARSAQ